MAIDRPALRERGFLILEGVEPDELVEIARSLGNMTFDRRSPELIREIRPQAQADAKPNTLSSRYGSGAFPFHTDTAHWTLPADYLLLHCKDPGSGGRRTILGDTRDWRLSPTEVDLACSALWAIGHRHPRIGTVGQFSPANLSIRFDLDCMRPLTSEAHKLRALIGDRIASQDQIEIEWHPNRLLIIDNVRFVHARGAAVKPDQDRTLMRILVGGSHNAVMGL